MLETRFPRPRGDIGNAADVRVSGSLPHRARRLAAPRRDRARPVAARAVHRRGARARARRRRRDHDELRLPRAVPARDGGGGRGAAVDVEPAARRRDRGAALRDGRRVGIVTADAASLSADHLRAVGARADTPREGLALDSRFRATAARGSRRARRRRGRAGDGRGRRAARRAPSRGRGDRPRVHQHAAVCRRRARGDAACRCTTSRRSFARGSAARPTRRRHAMSEALAPLAVLDRSRRHLHRHRRQASRRHADDAEAPLRQPRAVPRRRRRRDPTPARHRRRRADDGGRRSSR